MGVQSMPQPPAGQFFQAPATAPMAPPPGPRREMKGPSGIDDILKTFQEVRAADMDPSPPMFPPPSAPPSSYSHQPAMQAMHAVSDITSMHSGDASDAESVRTTGTNAGRRGRRKPTVPMGNTVTLNL